MDFKEMNAMITGAAQGMGKAVAEEMAGANANLALCDINSQRLKETAAELERKFPVRVIALQVNVANEQKVNDFVRKVEEELGSVDILINNAAIHPLHSIEKISSKEWDRVLAVNLKGYFLFAKAVLAGMRKQKFGRIINIASEAGKNGGTICGLHYAASKGGVLAFTRNLAKQVGNDGITVNAIAPGRIATAMARAVSDEANQVFIDRSAVKRLGHTQDVANAVHFLASRKSDFITGETLNINGGTLMD